ncbi:MAG: hypothetical protein AAFW89_14570, partial [Bacteroidota bacterium]
SLFLFGVLLILASCVKKSIDDNKSKAGTETPTPAYSDLGPGQSDFRLILSALTENNNRYTANALVIQQVKAGMATPSLAEKSEVMFAIPDSLVSQFNTFVDSKDTLHIRLQHREVPSISSVPNWTFLSIH